MPGGRSGRCSLRGPPPDVVLIAHHREVPDFRDVHGKQMEVATGAPSTTSGSTGLIRGHPLARKVPTSTNPAAPLRCAAMAASCGSPRTNSSPCGHHPGINPFGHRSRPYVGAQGSVTAPRSAPVTRRAYLANTPVV